MGKSEDNLDSFLLSHIWVAVLPVLCLGLLMWITETSSGLMPLRAANSEPIKKVSFEDHPFFDVEAESIPEVKDDGFKFKYEKTLISKVTGYTPGAESCGEFADGLTSIGHNAWSLDGVAADPSVLPYGTIVFIPGIGYREVDDTGSAMRDAWKKDKKIHIDLRFSNVSDALKWGVQQLPIHIFKPE